MLHDLDEADDRADDADGGGESAGGFEDGGNAGFDFADIVDLDLHDAAQLGGFGAVDGEHQGLAKKGVGHLREILVEGDDAFAAGFVGESDDLAEEGFAAAVAMEEDAHQTEGGGEDGFERELEHDGAEGSAEDDHGGGGLQHLAEMTAFEQQAGENAGQREKNAAKAARSMELVLGVAGDWGRASRLFRGDGCVRSGIHRRGAADVRRPRP